MASLAINQAVRNMACPILYLEPPHMMILRSSPPSPFGRKVKIAASLLGLSSKIEVVATDTLDPQDKIRSQNPLGKIPALILEDGSVYYDSRVIVEYLDFLGGGGLLIPAYGAPRFKVLTMAALADGILDAALLQIYELRFRDLAKHEPKWVSHQAEKVARGLAVLEASPPNGRRNVAHIGLACALGYLDLRFDGTWRKEHPNLVAWLEAFSLEVPSFEATRFIP
jgi:glutathione S-transferase